MTKKDYIKFAAMIRKRLEELNSDAIHERHTLRYVARDMADIFSADNHRFDEEKFFEACGISDY